MGLKDVDDLTVFAVCLKTKTSTRENKEKNNLKGVSYAIYKVNICGASHKIIHEFKFEIGNLVRKVLK